jgi:ADP-ribose pyrophosphatase
MKARGFCGTSRLGLFVLDNGYDFVSRKPEGNTVVDGNDKPDAVVIVARDAEGRLLVLEEDRPVVGGKIWDLPAGMIDGDESPVDAAKREVFEETGLTLDKAELWKYNPFVSPGMTDEATAIVTGYVSGNLTDANLQGDEKIKAFLMDPDDMVRAGFPKPDVRMSVRLAMALL